jgi:hypothetical protein
LDSNVRGAKSYFFSRAHHYAVEELQLKEAFLAKPYFQQAMKSAAEHGAGALPQRLRIIESHGDQVLNADA